MYMNKTFAEMQKTEEKINSLHSLLDEMSFYGAFGDDYCGDMPAIERDIKSLQEKLRKLRRQWKEDTDCTVCIL